MKQYLRDKKVVVIIFILAFIVRFWKVPELFFFGIDEEYQSLLALSIIKDFHVIWIGLSAGNTGFYVGPGLVYLHALLLWLTKLDPVILGYAASAIAIVTVVVLYFVTQNLFGRKTALISTTLYSFLPFVLQYDRRFWNPTLTPLMALLIFFCLKKSFHEGRWHLIGAFLLGASFHIHASLLIFVPIYIAVLLYQLNKARKTNVLLIVSSLLIFLIIYSPLIVYDFVHNFDNLKTPFRLLQRLGSKIEFNNYYVLPFLPLLAIFLGGVLKRIYSKLLIFFLFLYVVNAFFVVSGWSTKEGLAAKQKLVSETIPAIGNRSFYLGTNRNYLYFGGWKYLFEAYGKKPAASQADEMFGWIYPKEISARKPSLKVVITDNKYKLKDKPLSVLKSGVYKAFVFKND